MQEAFQLLLEEADRSGGQQRQTAACTSPVARELAPSPLKSGHGNYQRNTGKLVVDLISDKATIELTS